MPSAPRLPAPVQAEPLSIPADDRVRLDDNQRRAPIRPQPREPNPKHAIPRPQLRPLGGATIDGQLLPQREILNYQSGPTGGERPYAKQTLDCKLDHGGLPDLCTRLTHGQQPKNPDGWAQPAPQQPMDGDRR